MNELQTFMIGCTNIVDISVVIQEHFYYIYQDSKAYFKKARMPKKKKSNSVDQCTGTICRISHQSKIVSSTSKFFAFEWEKSCPH